MGQKYMNELLKKYVDMCHYAISGLLLYLITDGYRLQCSHYDGTNHSTVRTTNGKPGFLAAEDPYLYHSVVPTSRR